MGPRSGVLESGEVQEANEQWPTSCSILVKKFDKKESFFEIEKLDSASSIAPLIKSPNGMKGGPAGMLPVPSERA